MAVRTLAGKTLFISGASRGIGKAIALRAAQDGANIVIAAKTAEPHPKLPGTIYTAAKEIEKAGGKCLPCIVDIRFEDQVFGAVDKAVKKFGGIDILVNNASAIQLTGTLATDMKRYDLMMGVNARGTYLCSKACIPYLKKASNPHILNLSPPLNMNPRWFKDHVAYTMAKYGMSMCVLGMSAEFKGDGVAVNALWPRTAIYTAAMQMLGGGDVSAHCRKPEIISDSAYWILTQPSRKLTGKFLIDEDVLREAGVKDFDQYSYVKDATFIPDFFLDDGLADAETVAAQAASGTMKKPSKKPTASPRGAVPKVFDKIKTMLAPGLIEAVRASYQFELAGGEPGTWFVDLKKAPGLVAKGGPPEGSEADCTFKMTSEDFVSLFAGKLKAMDAFFKGKLRISGSMGAAMKLDKVMRKVAGGKSKL